METQSPTWRRLAVPLMFALVCVLCTIGIWISFGGTVPFAPQGYRFYIELPKATNVYEYTSVRVAGVTVGKVVSVSRHGRDGAQVLVQMDRQFSPMHRGATAIVRAKTLLGEGYIELAPGPASAPAIPDGGRLPASHVKPTEQLYDVLRTFTPGTRAQIRSLFSGLASAIHGRSAQLGRSIGQLAPVTQNLATIATSLNRQRGALSSLIDDSGVVFNALGTREGDLQSAITAGNQVFAATGQEDAALRRTVTALPPFLGQLRSTANTVSAASGDIGTAANTLEAATPQNVPAVNQIIRAAPTFRTLFTRLPGTLTAGRTALPSLTRLLTSARATLPSATLALRQLIPLARLGSASVNSIIATFANVGQILNGVELGENGQPSHFGSGVVSLWNETVGGWKVKLPTNRANAYPTPTEALGIASGGLSAYDCRNIHNPPYLPPLGTGAPSCKLQGPWTFDGKNAYYPRLALWPK